MDRKYTCENFEEKYFYKTNDILSVEATFHSILKRVRPAYVPQLAYNSPPTYFHSKLLPLQGCNPSSGIYGTGV